MRNDGTRPHVSICEAAEHVSSRMAVRFALSVGLAVVLLWPIACFVSVGHEIRSVVQAIEGALANLVVLGDVFQITSFLDSLKAGGTMDDYLIREARTQLVVSSSLLDPADVLRPGISLCDWAVCWVRSHELRGAGAPVADLVVRREIPFAVLAAGPAFFAFFCFPLGWFIRRQLRRFSQRLTKPIGEFSSALRQIDTLGQRGLDRVSRLDLGFTELKEVQDSFYSMFRAVRAAEERQRSLETSSKLGKLARQVAHDIRSPLTALQVAADSLAKSPDAAIAIIRSATERIKAISQDLTERSDGSRPMIAPGESETMSLGHVVEEIVGEKRTQYEGVGPFHFQMELAEPLFTIVGRLPRTTCQRILSNLLDNAVESMDRGGTITVRGDLDGNSARISIEDEGKGIPESVLPRLMKKGATFGKEKGSGLGLFHAKETLDGIGGEIEIQSFEGVGTTVMLRMPVAFTAPRFIRELVIPPAAHVVSLDDDPSIFSVWRHRLAEAGFPLGRFHSFEQADELERWVGDGLPDGGILLLCDYELRGQARNGVTVVKDLGLAEHAILVTNREDTSVLLDAARIGLPVLPKRQCPDVPLRLGENDQGVDTAKKKYGPHRATHSYPYEIIQ